jgi:hypothetical protein
MRDVQDLAQFYPTRIPIISHGALCVVRSIAVCSSRATPGLGTQVGLLTIPSPRHGHLHFIIIYFDFGDDRATIHTGPLDRCANASVNANNNDSINASGYCRAASQALGYSGLVLLDPDSQPRNSWRFTGEALRTDPRISSAIRRRVPTVNFFFGYYRCIICNAPRSTTACTCRPTTMIRWCMLLIYSSRSSPRSSGEAVNTS